jgi:hypothetical protein
MRLPTSKVYRAFPELDQFSDAQCLAFVRLANHDVSKAFVRFLLYVITGAVVAFVSGAVLIAILAEWQPSLMFGACFLLVGVTAPTGVALLALRDALLRDRIRRVFTLRGSCAGCSYALVGLPLGEAGTNGKGEVRCPECGLARAIEQADIQIDTAGLSRFLPA